MKEQIKQILQNWSFDEGLALYEKIGKNNSIKSWIRRKGEEKATDKLKYELEKLLGTPELVKKIAVEIIENENLQEVKDKIQADEDLLKETEYSEDEYYKDLVQEQNSAWNQELKLRNQNADFVNKPKEAEQHAQSVLAQREKRINLSQRIVIYKQTGKMTNDDMSKAISSYSVAEAQKTLTNSLRPKLSRRRRDLKKAKTESKRQELEKEIMILEAQEEELKKIIAENE